MILGCPLCSRRHALAGMAGVTAARTLVQAGHQVSVYEQAAQVGGRMATRETPWGSFDHGAQYFTVRDPRFALAGARAIALRAWPQRPRGSGQML